MTTFKRVAILTDETSPQLTADDRWLIPAFANRGVEAQPLVWTQDEFATFDAILVRSPWDYHLRYEEFTAWISRREAMGTRFVNEARLLRWNIHKKYLVELAQHGLPVMETHLIKRGEGLSPELRQKLFTEVVVKPAVSASAHQTRKLNWPLSGVDETWLRGFSEQVDVLVQPYAQQIETRGELSLVVIDGRVTHAYLKNPRPGDFRVQADFGGTSQRVDLEPFHQPLASRFCEAAAKLSGATAGVAYARVDLLPVGASDWVLGELELVEPALHFRFEPMAATLLADHVVSIVAWGE